MPMTYDQYQRQLDYEGVTDPEVRRQRIADAVQSGEIGPAEGPIPGGLAGAAMQAVQGAPAAEEPAPVVPTFRSPEEQAAGVAPPRPGEVAPEAPGPATPSLYTAPKAGMQAPGGPRTPGLRLPGLGGFEGALEKAPGAFEEAQRKTSEAYGKHGEALEELKSATRERMSAEAEILEEQARVSQELHAAEYQREQERQEIMDREIGKVESTIADLQSSGVDPYRFYRHPDGSTNFPKSIAAAIAVGLGALGSNLPRQYGGTGGPNVALQIIDRAIDRDIAAQRDDLANKRAGVGLQMNLLGHMRTKFADERQAEQAARAVMYDTYKLKLQEARASAGTPEAEAKIEWQIAAADIQKTQVLNDLGLKAVSQEILGEEKLLGARTGQAVARQRAAAAAAKAAGAKAGKQLPANAVTKMADFRAAGGILTQVQGEWNTKMKGKFAGGLAANAPWATEAKKYEDKIKAAAQFIGKKLEGRMTDEDYERILGMFPAPGDSDARAQEKFRALQGYLEAMEESTIRTYGETGYDVSGFQKGPKVQGEGKAL